MGNTVFDDVVPFATQPHKAAAVLCRTEHGNLHAGVMYRDDSGNVDVLHLGWQDYLSREWKWHRYWAAPDVEPERLVSVAALCRLIWQQFVATKSFPYALRFAQTSFTTTGQLRFGEGAKGLTCATFILAVFNTMGVQIVDETTWPVRPEDDKRFLDSIRGFASEEHFKVLEAEVQAGVVRIQPQEVLGACSHKPPASFDGSATEGARAIALVDQKSGAAPT